MYGCELGAVKGLPSVNAGVSLTVLSALAMLFLSLIAFYNLNRRAVALSYCIFYPAWLCCLGSLLFPVNEME